MTTKTRSKSATKRTTKAREQLLERTPQAASDGPAFPSPVDSVTEPLSGMIVAPHTQPSVNMQVTGSIDIEAMKRAAISRYRSTVNGDLSAFTKAHNDARAVYDSLEGELNRLLKLHGEQLAESLLTELDAFLKKHKVKTVSRLTSHSLSVDHYVDKIGGNFVTFNLAVEDVDKARDSNRYDRDDSPERFCFRSRVNVQLKDLSEEIRDVLKRTAECLKVCRQAHALVCKQRLKYEQITQVAEEIEAEISRAILSKTADGKALLAMIDEKIDAKARA